MRPPPFSRDHDRGLVRLYVWLMIVAAGLTVAVALFATRSDPQYATSAEVLIDPTITPSGNYIQPSMPTEQRVATSTDVVGSAAARLGVTSTQALRHLSVAVPVDTQVLVMTYTADTPAAARSGANAVAQSYLQTRNPANGKNAVASLVGPPQLPAAPVATNYPVIFGVAVLGGLLIGFAAAWTWDRIRGRIRTIGEVEQRTELDALAVLPRLPRRSSAGDQRISSGRAHLDALAARVVGGPAEDGTCPSVLVTGVGSGGGSTTVAVQIALALARMGRAVILVTADDDVIAGLSVAREPAHETGPSRGTWPDAATSGAARLRLVPAAEWDGRVDAPDAVVVIDGPPAWQSAGMALTVERILLVVALGRSSRTSTSAAVQALDHRSDKVMGLVVTPRRGRVRVALASVPGWVVHGTRRVMARFAPPAPAIPMPLSPGLPHAVLGHPVPPNLVFPSPVPTIWDPASAVPQMNGTAPRSMDRPRPDAPATLRGWTDLLGLEGHLSGAIAPDRICAVARVPVPHASGEPTRSVSS